MVFAGFLCRISHRISPPRHDISTLTHCNIDIINNNIMTTNTSSTVVVVAAAFTVVLSLQSTIRGMLANYIVPTIVLPSLQRQEVNRYHACRRLRVERKRWSRFSSRLTDRQFRRYFRMTKVYFQLLCDMIEDIVGPHAFKSELYLNSMMKSPVIRDGARNIFVVHDSSTGGMICGEIKLALALRVLGGGTYMDMAMVFDISFNHAHKIFKEVIRCWLTHDVFMPINGVEYCNDDARMNKVALGFSNASHGVMNGCIGDGWVVKIQKPSRRDNILNAQSFYSRKGYFAVNVQAIVDKQKRILFRSIISRGAEHDSTAFKHSSLYKWLLPNWQMLVSKGFYFIGDSAYSLKSFLLVPYDNAVHGTPEDDYNYYHSSSRITVECCFGDIDLQWGILWRELSYSLELNCKIIDACMRLHNFIVDHRCEDEINFSQSIDFEIFDDDCRRFYAVNPFQNSEGVYGGEEDVRHNRDGSVSRGGRPVRAETFSTDVGRNWRDKHREEICRQGLMRPNTNWYRIHNRVFEG